LPEEDFEIHIYMISNYGKSLYFSKSETLMRKMYFFNFPGVSLYHVKLAFLFSSLCTDMTSSLTLPLIILNGNKYFILFQHKFDSNIYWYQKKEIDPMFTFTDPFESSDSKLMNLNEWI
jgi:hypothetical protein